MDILIREVQLNDLNALQTLYLNLHESDTLPEGDKLNELWQSIIDDQNYHIYIAETDGRLVSSCTLVVIKNLTRSMRPYALIENVVTDKEYRNQGLASNLIERAVEDAKAAGCYKVMLLTGAKDEATLRFYERAGFNREDKTGFIRWV